MYLKSLFQDNSSKTAYSYNAEVMVSFYTLMSENLREGPHIFTERGPIGFKSGRDFKRVDHSCVRPSGTMMQHKLWVLSNARKKIRKKVCNKRNERN